MVGIATIATRRFMKRSEFIQKVLSHEDNTVFTGEGTIESALNLFELLGMIPPNQYACTNEFRFEWEDEHEKN